MKQQTHAFARSKSFEPIRISFKFYKVKVDSSSRQIHFYTHHITYHVGIITHPYTLILLIIILQPRYTYIVYVIMLNETGDKLKIRRITLYLCRVCMSSFILPKGNKPHFYICITCAFYLCLYPYSDKGVKKESHVYFVSTVPRVVYYARRFLLVAAPPPQPFHS